MHSRVMVNDTKLHSIDSIEFLKVQQQQAIIALYHIQFEITSFCYNGNATIDIFPGQENENTIILSIAQKGVSCLE